MDKTNRVYRDNSQIGMTTISELSEMAHNSEERNLVKEILAECENKNFSRFQILTSRGGKEFVTTMDQIYGKRLGLAG